MKLILFQKQYADDIALLRLRNNVVSNTTDGDSSTSSSTNVANLIIIIVLAFFFGLFVLTCVLLIAYFLYSIRN